MHLFRKFKDKLGNNRPVNQKSMAGVTRGDPDRIDPHLEYQ